MSNVSNEDELGSKQAMGSQGSWDSDNQAEREISRSDSDKPRIVSVKGGGRGKHNNPGNFANDRARASEAGRKGGEARGRHHHQQH